MAVQKKNKKKSTENHNVTNSWTTFFPLFLNLLSTPHVNIQGGPKHQHIILPFPLSIPALCCSSPSPGRKVCYRGNSIFTHFPHFCPPAPFRKSGFSKQLPTSGSCSSARLAITQPYCTCGLRNWVLWTAQRTTRGILHSARLPRYQLGRERD